MMPKTADMDEWHEGGAAERPRPLRKFLMTAAAGLIACGMFSAQAWSQSIGDRFKSLFGGGSEPPAQGGAAAPPSAEINELTCPPVSIRSGASTYAVGMPGKPASGNDLRYQATITRTARDCNYNTASGQITARIGIQGRVIAGPAGAPPSVDVPLRVAVVQESVQPKTIFTKAYQTAVAVSADGTVSFSLVAEDIVYPAPQGAAIDQYVFYIGFDPQALKPEPRARGKKR